MFRSHYKLKRVANHIIPKKEKMTYPKNLFFFLQPFFIIYIILLLYLLYINIILYYIIKKGPEKKKKFSTMSQTFLFRKVTFRKEILCLL
jgi:hypothetical protein